MTEKKNTRSVVKRLGPSVSKPSVKAWYPARTPLFALALESHITAVETGKDGDLALAHVLDAAFVMSRRATDDESTKEFLTAVRKYLKTKKRSERFAWPLPLLSRRGPERTNATRYLILRANQAAAALEKRPSETDSYASLLLTTAHSLGLYKTATVLRRSAYDTLSTRLKREIANGSRLDGELVAKWTLEATGVGNKKADNIVGAALKEPKAVKD